MSHSNHMKLWPTLQGALLLFLATLASVYGPNWDDNSFVAKSFTSLKNIENDHIILGEDFDLVLDPISDRMSNKVFSLTKSAMTLYTLA